MIIRNVCESDLEECFKIESACFEESEAASLESIKTRIQTYPEGFIVGVDGEKIVGMVNSGSINSDDITDEEFKKLIGHESDGKNIVIFSICVHPDFQRRKIASKLMDDFIKRSKEMGKEKILLLCKDHLIDFYRDCGFDYIGISNSTHGGFKWHEMAYNNNDDNL